MKPSFEVLRNEGNPLPAPRATRRSVFRTLRFFALWAAAAYCLYCYLFSKPLFAHPLPQHTGPYAVGAIDIEAPVFPPRTIHSARFRDTDEKAFELETVLFTLYYPAPKGAALTSKHRHTWIPDPLPLRAQGYAKAAHISNAFTNTIFTYAIRALVGGITIPAAVDVPLSARAFPTSQHKTTDTSDAQEVLGEQTSPDDFPSQGYPIIVFSHGTVSSRTDYSHYAGELAARGHLVVMLEHRDGSCPGSVIMQPGSPNRTLLLFDESEVLAANGSAIDIEEYHRAQLNFREAEIEEAVHVMKRINAGQGAEVFKQNPRGEGLDLANWAGRLDTSGMIVAGHSYGATGALQALRNGPNEKRPFKGGIILDPGKQSGPLNRDISVPLLVVHSNSWSSHSSVFYGRAHFDTVKEIVEANNERGESELVYDQYWDESPVGDRRAATGAGLRQYVHVAEDFLAYLADGQKRGLLKEKAEFPQYDEGAIGMWKPGQSGGEEKTDEWWDWRRYWQIHVSPVGSVDDQKKE
ncbi:hypothetical protein N0V88_007577 [Collariella sp. IMI 366227]|nr:hypothetical protein N0V88_007577 [Collariella sp. IMI 366227]